MNLSFMSFSFQTEILTRRMDADRLCRLVKESGMDTIDLMGSEIRLYKIGKLLRAFEKYQVKCGCVIETLPFFRGVDRYPAKLEKAFSLCEKIGADTLMIVPGAMDEKACSLLRREEMLRRAEELFTLATERAKEKNIEILFEDTPQACKPLSSAADCRKILDAVPSLGFVFDTANFMVSENDFDILSDYELLKDRIRRVHVKDVVRGRFGSGERCENGDMIRCVAPGAGIVPLAPFLSKLNKDGYDGTVCAEYAAGEIRGEAHGRYIASYVRTIRALLDGEETGPSYGEIPGLNAKVSKIFFGTAIRPMLEGKNVNSLLDAVLASGINAFDCARGYGMAEKSLGRWIRERNNRDRVIILTKCGNVGRGGRVCVNRGVILSELEKSLKALGVDCIDIYLLHRDDPATPVSEIMDTLNECKSTGKIRLFGVSNWTHTRINEANAYAKSKGLCGFFVSSPNYGLARQVRDPWGGGCVTLSGPENEEARQWYTGTQMPVICYSSLARGFFSGRFEAFDYENAKKVLDGPAQEGYLCKENMRRLANAKSLAEKLGTTVPDIALRYVFSNQMNAFAIVSSTDPGRLAGNTLSSRLPLTPDETEFLEKDQT